MRKLALICIIISVFFAGFSLYPVIASNPLGNFVIVDNQGVEFLAPKSRASINYFWLMGTNRIAVGYNSTLQVGILKGDSMYPTAGDGSIFILTKIPVSDIQVGDIILYKWNEENVLHRVIRLGEDEYGWFVQTKGDGNLGLDWNLIREDAVLGVVLGVFW